jgi:hypothetical protein
VKADSNRPKAWAGDGLMDFPQLLDACVDVHDVPAADNVSMSQLSDAGKP